VKRRIAVAAALAVTLLGSVAACGSSKDSDDVTTAPTGAVDGKGKTIKVWLMVDAQSAWKNVVDDATSRFTAATGAQVNVEYQQWCPTWSSSATPSSPSTCSTAASRR
jgi:N,N'-diacetylchitobiose transport system substrate-binding protein